MADLVTKHVHEVWWNPGWDDEERSYKGDDPTTAALSFAACAQRITNPKDSVVWTVDGATHEVSRW